jgi:hypothetical protein
MGSIRKPVLGTRQGELIERKEAVGFETDLQF